MAASVPGIEVSAPTIADPVYVASRDIGRTGGQIEIYDEAGVFHGTLDDPLFASSGSKPRPM